MTGISQSASLASIAAYLKHTNDYDEQTAQKEAREVMHNLVTMRQKGFITGWYFDEQGHLELLPSDAILKRIDPPK
ncbi:MULTISPECIES: hypothetical protein [Shewanella]|uniref:Uncharacterized protein n=1 Tax=Shewanella chilikensis TaxID=558541 RepID=A0A6G7LU02_9GAMM|nr:MULTISPECIES: hypothetical protein [Shewanella]EKT4488086.1 hypothetical protein [Shewanella algae]MBO2548573.1 hypothetical protein [Shewanella algae]MBO2675809.1 hypothetical protein [Shewanella algae]MBZ4680658.1 hypothetical protein [Shewanella sp.]MCE9854255.1 hypothetical protein [Shewanella chilikensis]